MYQILEQIEADVQSRPSPIEFEMAYQARVAIDRIKFAIKHTEQFCPQSEQMREAWLQLLDALGRLQAVDRRFQTRSRLQREAKNGDRTSSLNTNQTGGHASRNGGSRPGERQVHT
jgi:hypothetical protein